MTGARPTRRLSIFRSIGYVLLGSGLCLVFLLLYLQTSHAFMHVIVPLANVLLSGDLEAENGSLTLPATLDVTGLSYREPDIGLIANVGRVHVSLSIVASLREWVLVVDDVGIDRGDIGLVVPPDRNGGRGDLASSSGWPFVRWAVRRGHVEECAVSVKTNDQEVSVTDIQATVKNAGFERNGTIDGQGEVTVQRRTNESHWAGRIAVTGSLRQDAGGRRFEWDTINELIVRDSPLSPSDRPAGVLSVDQRTTGSYDVVDAALQAESVLTIRLGEHRLVDASVTLRRTGSGPQTETDLGVRIQEVSAQALNLLVDEQRAVRFRAVHVGGYVDVHAIGTRYAGRSVFSGEQLQVVFDQVVTPPLDVDLAQTGTFDSDSMDLALEIFDVHAADQHKVWLTGELKRTLTFKLGAGPAEREDPEPANVAQPDWALRINDLSVADLRQWFEAFRWKGLDGLREGRVGGIMTASGRRSGKAVDLALNVTVSDVVMEAPDGIILGPPVTLQHVGRGSLIELTKLKIASFMTTASVLGERSKGTLTLSGTVDLASPATDLDLRGSLALNDLHAGALNPVLARWTKAGFNRGHFNGTAQASITGAWLRWEIDLRGRQISLYLPNRARPTHPADMVVKQVGRIDRTGRALHIDKAVLQTFQRSHPVLTAVLDHPIQVPLGRTGRKPAAARGDTPLATLGIEVHRLDIEDLRSRLEFLKLAPLDQIKTGVIESRLTVRWWGEAEPLAIAGNLDLEGVTLDAGALRIGSPLILRNRIDATVKDSSLVEVATWSLRAFDGTTSVANARLSGMADLGDGTLDLSTRFNTGDMTGFLFRMGLLDRPKLKSLAGGAVTADVRASSQGSGAPLSLRVSIRSRSLQLKPVIRRALIYDVDARGTVEVNGPRTAVEVRPLVLTFRHAAQEAGSLSVWGRWPIGASESEATARIVAKNVDCEPVIDLYGALPGRHPGPLPLYADVTVAVNTKNGQVAVSGQETVGPATVSRKDGGPAEATVRLAQDVLWHNQVVSVSKLTLTADRPNGTADHASVNGRVNVGSMSQAEFEGKITSLDAAWYAALLSKPASAAHASVQAEGEPGQKPTRRPSGVKAAPANVLFKHLDGVISIGSISYGGLKIGPGRLTMRGTQDRIDLAVEPTGLADGKVEATMALTGREWQGQGTGRFEWTGRGEGLNIETLLKAVEPGEVARMSGLGSFQTAGSGVQGVTLPGERVKASLSFTITGGQFSRVPLASFLARETHVDEFNRMGFSEIRGDMRQEADEITMDRLVALGNVSSLEGSGKMGSDGILNGLIFVKIGPSFRRNIKIPCMSAILLLPDGFAALPFAVRVSGTPKAPVFRVDTSPWDQAKGTITGFAGRMKNLVMGCRESS